MASEDKEFLFTTPPLKPSRPSLPNYFKGMFRNLCCFAAENVHTGLCYPPQGFFKMC